MNDGFSSIGGLKWLMALLRITARWSGFSGAPGYTNFHFAHEPAEGAKWDASNAAVRTFFNSIAGLLPTGVLIQFPTVGDVLDEGTGALEDTVPLAAQASVAGSGSTLHAAPVGMVVNWTTGIVVNGRRVRGRTFLVPMTNAVFAADGTPLPASVTTLQSAAAALIGNAATLTFVIWARPAPPGVGVGAPVQGYSVPDIAAVLRSRRD